MPVSGLVSRVSAALLLLGGAAMLFAPDLLLPRLVPGFPTAGLWMGQLLGAAWLGLAALNWLQRATRLGGIYGRPVVLANLVFYFVAAMALLRPALGAGTPAPIWWVVLPCLVLSVVYAALLFRGPFESG